MADRIATNVSTKYPKIPVGGDRPPLTTKKMFRLTHRESGGEKKKTWLRNQN